MARQVLVALLGYFAICASASSYGETIEISRAVSVFDCSKVSPGSVLVLPTGIREPLRLNNCRGTSESPIRLVSDQDSPERTVIQRTASPSGGHVFQCHNCAYFVMDGKKSESDMYGIKITITGGESPSWFLRFSGRVNDVTVSKIEIDGRWPQVSDNGIGLSFNDHSLSKTSLPNVWYENITIVDNYIHDVEGEGLYVGPNWPQDGLPLRNILIENNRVERTGWDGIQLKSAIAGRNRISNNRLNDIGIKTGAVNQQAGIMVYESSAEVSSNIVINTGAQGILHFLKWLPIEYGPMTVEVFNNVVVGAGMTQPQKGFGIKSSNDSGYAVPIAVVRNNTIVDTTSEAIELGARVYNGIIENNLISNANAGAFSYPATTRLSGNLVVEKTNFMFKNVEAYDFSLAKTSIAIDAATGVYPLKDINGQLRPIGAGPDVGAYEFQVGVGATPKSPSELIVR